MQSLSNTAMVTKWRPLVNFHLIIYNIFIIVLPPCNHIREVGLNLQSSTVKGISQGNKVHSSFWKFFEPWPIIIKDVPNGACLFQNVMTSLTNRLCKASEPKSCISWQCNAETRGKPRHLSQSFYLFLLVIVFINILNT